MRFVIAYKVSHGAARPIRTSPVLNFEANYYDCLCLSGFFGPGVAPLTGPWTPPCSFALEVRLLQRLLLRWAETQARIHYIFWGYAFGSGSLADIATWLLND
jgi:hypothetical protein